MGKRSFDYAITAGELGASAAQSVLIVLLPLLLAEHTRSATSIGLVIGAEGVCALLLPPLVGSYSDKVGSRNHFLRAGALLMAIALVTVPLVGGYWLLAGLALFFFAALQSYITPLWTLLLDHVPQSHYGITQGARGVWRTGGLMYGLVVAGLLFDVWRALPFFVAAALVLITTQVTLRAQPERGERVLRRQSSGHWREALRALRGNERASWTLVANALWNGAIDGVRPYIFLFATVVFGLSVARVSLGLLSLAGTLVLGSLVLGRLSDRYSRSRLLQIGTVIGGLAMLAGLVVRDVTVAVIILLFAGFGMSTIIVVSYPLFATFVGNHTAATYTGMFAMSTGIGRALAPLLVGVAIDAGKHVFPAHRGLPMMWAVAGLLMLSGTLALRRAVKK